MTSLPVSVAVSVSSGADSIGYRAPHRYRPNPIKHPFMNAELPTEKLYKMHISVNCSLLSSKTVKLLVLIRPEKQEVIVAFIYLVLGCQSNADVLITSSKNMEHSIYSGQS
jgi:hypothetical protein